MKGCDIPMKNILRTLYIILQDPIPMCKIQYHLSVAKYKAKHSQTKVVRKHDPNVICEYRNDK